MTDKTLFLEAVKDYGLKKYEIASALGMSTQSLTNKLENVTEFTQIEMEKFRQTFPKVSDSTFQEIFFAKE